MKSVLAVSVLILVITSIDGRLGITQTRRDPVIDMHLHAEKLDSYIANQSDIRWFPNLRRPGSDEDLMKESLAALARNVDVSWIDWYLPRAEFHGFLKRLVEAGFADRIMFGSDQMQWPDTIGLGIEGIESTSFLSAGQKRAILCSNAARFLRLDAKICR